MENTTQKTPQDENKAGQPSTEEEWIVHSINIHGTPFQRWCHKRIEETRLWKVKAIDYPVESPTTPIYGGAKESNLDIRAELDVFGGTRLTLLIECKKNNPDFINWVFFQEYNPPYLAHYLPLFVYCSP